MLVLARKRQEDIVCVIPPSTKPQYVTITMVEVRGDKARIGVDAAKDIIVDRGEIYRIKVANGELKP